MKNNYISPYKSSPKKAAPYAPADLPEPEPEKAGSRKMAFLALAAVLAIAFAIFWLQKTPDERANLRKSAGDAVNQALADTPLAGAGNVLTPPAPGLPEQVINPPTESGTLAGRQISGTIAAPMDFGPAAGAAGYALPRDPATGIQPETPTAADTIASLLGMETAPKQEPVTFTQNFVEPAKEDDTLKPGYISGLANWLVNRYRPGANGGALAAGPQALNQECGSNLASQTPGGRAALLRYAFHPTMINALYNLYIDRFMDDLDAAAQKKGLNEAETKQMHRALAGEAAMLAQMVDGAIQTPNLGSQLEHINQLAQKVVDANADLAAAVFELDSARESGSSAQLSAAQTKVDSLGNSVREAEGRHSQAQAALASTLRKFAGPGMNEDSLLFVAAWVQRRQAGNPQARKAMETSINVLHDFAARCAKAAEES